jgi:hypothetical protein
MKSVTRLASELTLPGVVIILAAWFSACPRPVAAQGTQGQNAICSSSSGCSTAGSSAFVDASMFAVSTDTICSAIYKILSPVTYSATVIDARGLPGNTGASMTCANGTSPWGSTAPPTLTNLRRSCYLPGRSRFPPPGFCPQAPS